MATEKIKDMVAEQANHEEQVIKELTLQKDWQKSWGVLYNPGGPETYEEMIKHVETKIANKKKVIGWTVSRDYEGRPSYDNITKKKYRDGNAVKEQYDKVYSAIVEDMHWKNNNRWWSKQESEKTQDSWLEPYVMGKTGKPIPKS